MELNRDREVPAEALRYARLLTWGMRAGLALLLASFAAYAMGLWPPHVPLTQLPALWSLPVDAYLQATASPQGWDWLTLAARGDFANLVGIAVLASCSVLPLLAVIPQFLRQRAPAYAIICALQILVLLLAASGWLAAAH